MNRCRSPMAEALWRAALAARGIGPGQSVVASAGTTAAPGRGVPPEGVEVLGRRGIDLTTHRSRLTDAATVGGAELVLTMTREHVRAVAVEHPGSFGRTFTLKDYVRRARAAGGRRPDEPMAAWLARVGEGRRAADTLGADPADDVADPIGQPVAAYERCVAELDTLIAEAVELTYR